MTIHIGTSGWHYKHWRGTYYPDTLSSSKWLDFYARDFNCVEINSTFYRLPSDTAISSWLAATPESFKFAIKASRYITHQKKLKKCREPLQKLRQVAAKFGDKLGPLVFQFPPHWEMNLERLASFVELLPVDLQITMEFRDPAWHYPAVWNLLAENDITWCEFDLSGVESPKRQTGSFTYLRLHGPGPDAYCGNYNAEQLADRATQLLQLEKKGIDSWVFFDNDQAGHAVENARQLKSLCQASRINAHE